MTMPARLTLSELDARIRSIVRAELEQLLEQLRDELDAGLAMLTARVDNVHREALRALTAHAERKVPR